MSSLRRKLKRGSLEIITIDSINGPETWLAKRRRNPIRFRKTRKGNTIAQYLPKYIPVNRVA